MKTEQIHHGTGDNVARDKITYITYQSLDYQKLQADLDKLNADFEKNQQKIAQYPDDEDFKIMALDIDALRQEKIQEIEAFKAQVAQLYDTFYNKPINTQRQRLAKDLFDQGDFRAANAVLKEEDMKAELHDYLRMEQKGREQIQKAQEGIQNISQEYLMKAQLTALDWDNPDRFALTCAYYEQAISASANFDNCFEYAHFLQNHNQMLSAQRYYEQCLTFIDDSEENEGIFSNTLNNLANLYSDKNEFESAEKAYLRALEIRERLAQTNPQTYEPDVSMTLNNLANLYSDKNEFE
nr:tetratricopeptide repeat protein [Thermoflexibacter sp.]